MYPRAVWTPLWGWGSASPSLTQPFSLCTRQAELSCSEQRMSAFRVKAWKPKDGTKET